MADVEEEMTPSLLMVLVIYERKLNESQSFQVIRSFEKNHGHKNWHLLVIDHSMTSDSDTPKYPYLTYKHEPANKGLSHAYNYGADQARAKKFTHLLLLDQDSVFDDSFLHEIIHKMENTTNPLWIPKVFSSRKLLSPFIWKGLRGRVITKKELARLTAGDSLLNLSWINSGVLIRLDIFFDAGQYNEDFFIDLCDVDFSKRCLSKGVFPKLLSTSIEQNFHNLQSKNPDSLNHRFILYCKGLRTLAPETNKLFLREAVLMLTAVKWAIRHRSLRFFKSWVKSNE